MTLLYMGEFGDWLANLNRGISVGEQYQTAVILVE